MCCLTVERVLLLQAKNISSYKTFLPIEGVFLITDKKHEARAVVYNVFSYYEKCVLLLQAKKKRRGQWGTVSDEESEDDEGVG